MKLSQSQRFTIREENNEIHDNLLNIVGNVFKFDHAKGIGEWLKNSVDAYIRSNIPDEQQFIVLKLTDERGENPAMIECIDFVGMTHDDFRMALKKWGDPGASKRGMAVTTYGGHGNGGKFYMREMFEQSNFIAYRDGKINVFGFNKNKKYGFAEGFENKSVSLTDALEFAGLNGFTIPKSAKDRLVNGTTGFTVVRGYSPQSMPRKITEKQLCTKIKNHPQSRRLIQRIHLSVIHNDKVIYSPLRPDPLPPKPGFDNIFPINVPPVVTVSGASGERKDIALADDRYGRGVLSLSASDIAMEVGSRYEELNRIDIIGELGVVASYRVGELPNVGYTPQLSFIYGECSCPILEDPSASSVENDRTRLIDNDRSKALLGWIGEKVRELAEQMADSERKQQENKDKQLSSFFNDYLNTWKNHLMPRIYSTILVGPGDGPGSGRTGTGGSSGGQGTDKNESGGGTSGNGPGGEEGGGSIEKSGRKAPQVLLSGYDADPLDPSGAPLMLDPRQGVVYQRIQDVKEGIWWINTASPLASAIIERFNVNSTRWRDYLLQRYVDIFVKDSLSRLAEKDPDSFTPSGVDRKISEVMTLIQEAAAKDLGAFLFEDEFRPEVPQKK